MVDLDGGTTDEIVIAVEACPTGALRYDRHDGAPGEQPPDPVQVTALPKGPLFIRGAVEVSDVAGEREMAMTRVALCRCGASNQPFCDNSHLRIGFEDRDRAVSEHRQSAEDPSEAA